MILTCPQCATKFHVNPKRIAETGTRVRCARCKEVFLATPPQQQPAPPPEQEEVTPLPEQQPEPEPAEKPGRFHPDPIVDEPDLPSDMAEVDFDYDRFQELDAKEEAGDDEADGTTSDEDHPSQGLAETPAPADDADEGSASFSTSDEMDNEEDHLIRQKPARNSPFAALIRIVLLLILAILIVAGVMVVMNGPDHLTQLVRQYFGQQTPPAPPLSGQMVLGELDGQFIINEQGGELFLIRGLATNHFNQAQSAVQVKGILYDQHGKPLAQKTVFCGNPMTDEELRTLPFSELEQRMGNQFGKDLSNMNIPPGKAVPFAIVFRNLPENVSEFSVAVTASNPADQ